MLPLFKNLKTLGLTNCQMDDENLAHLAGKMDENACQLEALMIPNNKCTDQGLICFSLILLNEKIQLKNLIIGDNLFTDFGMIHFINSIQENTTIQTLSLHGLKMSNKVLFVICELLIHNKVLKSLNLGDCSISDELLMHLKSGLKSNENLKELYLWENNITNKGAKFLLDILKHENRKLEYIGLQNLSLIHI
eukprot:TRINITY_DN19811_c0_g1_i1.p1 TRINITY_DN19811_c0_g1~~TRINITY_DN19811_c0_g1_i1.p1  ORF type:complete len:193 (-),score=40.01 TRINITY_DN19811_c0_g1_i1:79-657(-)